MQYSDNIDPLAAYLESRFGDVYEVLFWTPELADAVTEYLVHVVSEKDYTALCDQLMYLVPVGSRKEQAKFIVENHAPEEVAVASRLAAVASAPALEQLLQWLDLTSADYYDDISWWLNDNATADQLVGLFSGLSAYEPPAKDSDWWMFELGDWLKRHRQSPAQLLSAWDAVNDPNPSIVRAWAREQGHYVGSRGPIPESTLKIYRQAQGQSDL